MSLMEYDKLKNGTASPKYMIVIINQPEVIYLKTFQQKTEQN